MRDTSKAPFVSGAGGAAGARTCLRYGAGVGATGSVTEDVTAGLRATTCTGHALDRTDTAATTAR